MSRDRFHGIELARKTLVHRAAQHDAVTISADLAREIASYLETLQALDRLGVRFGGEAA